MPIKSECFRCERKAVYFKPYSGEKLCSSCFKESIVEKVRKSISKFGMLKYGEKVAVAVSGGKDSLSLLFILSKLCKDRGSRLVALTVDEGIEGYRDEAVRCAEEVCSKLDVESLCVSFKELFGFTLDEALKKRSASIKFTSCSFCGVLRRRALDIAASRVEADVIATAHNLDDYIQTFFINLLSGDLERIRWLDPSLHTDSRFGVRRIKPLLEVYEKEIAFYAYLKGIPFQTVSCPYREESIRSEIRNFLNSLEAGHPGIKYSVLKSALESSRSLQVEVKTTLTRCESCGFPSVDSVCQVCQMLQPIRNR